MHSLQAAVDLDASGTRLQVIAKTRVAQDVCRLDLADPARRRLPDWAPGAHIDLLLPGGLTRQYSLCGDRWDPYTWSVAVLRELGGRGGSAYVHDTLAVGDLIGVAGPRNNFRLVPAERYLFIAGGIGITPLLPMMQQADLMGTPWQLLYGGRTRASMGFLEQVEAYGDRVVVRPQDEFGLLDVTGVVDAQPDGTKVYCCGPGPLLDAVCAHCAGWAAGQLRIERFVPMDLSAPEQQESFEVVLKRSGGTVTVEPAMTVLDAVARAGVNVLSSCRQGTCGTCETTVLAGHVDHRDSLLDDAERSADDCMFICVSRARSDRLVLDL